MIDIESLFDAENSVEAWLVPVDMSVEEYVEDRRHQQAAQSAWDAMTPEMRDAWRDANDR